MADLEIKITCPRCEGVGSTNQYTYDSQGNVTNTEPEDPCTKCNGDTTIQWGTVVCDELDDILDKCNDIFEKVNE